jgi:hypothetical protein
MPFNIDFIATDRNATVQIVCNTTSPRYCGNCARVGVFWIKTVPWAKIRFFNLTLFTAFDLIDFYAGSTSVAGSFYFEMNGCYAYGNGNSFGLNRYFTPSFNATLKNSNFSDFSQFYPDFYFDKIYIKPAVLYQFNIEGSYFNNIGLVFYEALWGYGRSFLQISTCTFSACPLIYKGPLGSLNLENCEIYSNNSYSASRNRLFDVYSASSLTFYNVTFYDLWNYDLVYSNADPDPSFYHRPWNFFAYQTNFGLLRVNFQKCLFFLLRNVKLFDIYDPYLFSRMEFSIQLSDFTENRNILLVSSASQKVDLLISETTFRNNIEFQATISPSWNFTSKNVIFYRNQNVNQSLITVKSGSAKIWAIFQENTVLSNSLLKVDFNSINGVTIIYNSVFSNHSVNAVGSAIYLSPKASLEISNSIFADLSSIMGGSIFTSSDSQLLIKNSSFQRISSILSSGGVIFLSSGATIILSNSYFEFCSSSFNGGILFLERSNIAKVYNSKIRSFNAVVKGGAFYLGPGSSLYVINSSLFESMATFGGAFYLEANTSLEIENSSSKLCQALYDGGIAYASQKFHEIRYLIRAYPEMEELFMLKTVLTWTLNYQFFIRIVFPSMEDQYLRIIALCVSLYPDLNAIVLWLETLFF